MKILDRYIIVSYLRTFFSVFIILVLIFVLQTIWLYIKELAGKDAQFAVTVKSTEEMILPEMEQEFFSKYGIEDADEEKFTSEIVKNMERELAQSINTKVKQQIVDQLVVDVFLSLP